MLRKNLIHALKRHLLLGGLLFFLQGSMMRVEGAQHFQGKGHSMMCIEFSKGNDYKERLKLYPRLNRLYYEELEKYREELAAGDKIVYEKIKGAGSTHYKDFVLFKYGLFRTPDSLFHPMALFGGMIVLYILFRGGFCYLVGEQPPTFGQCFRYFLSSLIFTSMGHFMGRLLFGIVYYNTGWATISVHVYYPLLWYVILLILCTVVWDFFLKVIGYSDLSSPLGIGKWLPPLCLFSLAYGSLWFLVSPERLFGLRREVRTGTRPLDCGLLLSFIVIDFFFNAYFKVDSLQACWKRSSWGLLGGKLLTACYMGCFKVWKIDKNANEKEACLFRLFLTSWLSQHMFSYLDRFLGYILSPGIQSIVLSWVESYFPLVELMSRYLNSLNSIGNNGQGAFQQLNLDIERYFTHVWKLCLFVYGVDFLTWMLGFQDEIVISTAPKVKASMGVRGEERMVSQPNQLVERSPQKDELVPVPLSEVGQKGDYGGPAVGMSERGDSEAESDGLAPASGGVAMPPEEDAPQPTIESGGVPRKYRRYGALLLLFLLAIAIIIGPYKDEDEGERTTQ